jgi:NitT/TauT family transport system permease protein
MRGFRRVDSVLRIWRNHQARIYSLGGLALAWEILSWFFPPYLVPSLGAVLGNFVQIFVSPNLLEHFATTIVRLLLGVGVSFVVGSILALCMSFSARIERYVIPLVEFLMGIPSLALVVIVIIWVPFVELRVFVVLLLVCFPFFTVQILDGIKGISNELVEMLRIFRPSRSQLFVKLILPGVIPAILTSWKVTIAFGTRAVVIAELVGATIGIGNRLLTAQEEFEMAAALAWTLTLVAFLGFSQVVIGTIEKYLLRWRPVAAFVARDHIGSS